MGVSGLTHGTQNERRDTEQTHACDATATLFDSILCTLQLHSLSLLSVSDHMLFNQEPMRLTNRYDTRYREREERPPLSIVLGSCLVFCCG